MKPFPAGAGMNRADNSSDGLTTPVPRRRGDEPTAPSTGFMSGPRSPQARG